MMDVESCTAFQLTSSRGDLGAIISCKGVVLLWGQMHGYEQVSWAREQIKLMLGQVSMKMLSVDSNSRVPIAATIL
jgi:hypothetical protein